MSYEALSTYRAKCNYLLASLVLLILLSPFFEGWDAGHFAIDALFCLVLLATVNVAGANRQIQLITWVLAAIAIMLIWGNKLHPSAPSPFAGMVLFVVLNVFTIFLMLRRIVRAGSVTFEVLNAGVGLYLLIGVTWALTYFLVDIIDPNAFKVVTAASDIGWTDFLYFSFSTLTTLGYGDISPDAPAVRIWAVMEAVTGVLYIAILIARLVSLYRS